MNLTTASYVVLYDPWWNPAVEAQAIDRSHRIGQTQTVNAYRLISPGTVEEKIWELQQSKAQTIADVLGRRRLRPQPVEDGPGVSVRGGLKARPWWGWWSRTLSECASAHARWTPDTRTRLRSLI